CEARGRGFPGQKPGHVPFGRLVGAGERLASLADMSYEFVHWTHARAVLAERNPNVSESVRRTAYEFALVSRIKLDGDARAMMALDSDITLVRSHGVWLHAKSLEPLDKLSNDSYNSLPWLYHATINNKGEVKLKLRGPRRDLAKSSARLPGYIPVRAVRGTNLRRTLTVPSSIDDGVGPECAKKMGL
ncbi:MAG: DUF6011 domain-containing protein, partial [Gammaproteobacteria bacterium]